MGNAEIAGVLRRMGRLLEIEGGNPFRVRSYERAAETLERLDEDVGRLLEEGRLEEVPGIGRTLAAKIAELRATGRLEAYERLSERVPETLLDVIEIPSVGPGKARLFFQRLGVRTIEDLERAAVEGRLDGLPGIREKTVANILAGLRVLHRGRRRMDAARAHAVAEEIIDRLRGRPGVREIVPAGSLRRMCETVGDIDILVVSDRPASVMEAFTGLPQVGRVLSHGETRSSVLTRDDVQVDLRVVDRECFGAALLYFTGSKAFNIRLRQIAQKKGYKLSEYGVFSVEAGREVRRAGRTEAECLRLLGLPEIPPELREEIGEEELFEAHRRPRIPRLVSLDAIQGDLHVHSTWSDGRDSIAEMAAAGRRRGYRYLAVCDHSASLKVAGGLSVEDLDRKREEIAAVNRSLRGFRVLFGTEIEIDKEGGLDYPEDVLERFDVVVAAVHTGFDQDEERITRRLLRACAHPHVHVIAHPTGRHLGKREPCAVDLPALYREAARTGTILEINAFPIRLDLDGASVYQARKAGVRFAVDTDAHAADHLDFMRFGVGAARRGWLTASDVVNTLPLAELLDLFRSKTVRRK